MISFNLYNASDAEGPVFVPRLLLPFGVFIQARIDDNVGQTVYESPVTKATFTFDPASDTSYQELQPGYAYGAIIELDDADLAPGRYALHVDYTNRQYRGTPAKPVGELSAGVSVELTFSL
jgi:hypothetical protein